MRLIESEAEVVQDGVVHRTQDIPAEYLAALADERAASRFAKLPEAYRVASLPAALVETWLTQGFDVFREDARAIVKRLQAEGLTAFITTSRSV